MDDLWSNSANERVVQTKPPTWASWTALVAAALSSQLQAERQRWFLWLPVLLSCGIAIYFHLPLEPPVWAVAGLAVLALSLIVGAVKRSMSPIVAGCVATILVGICVASVRTLTAGPGNLILPHGVVVVEGWVERMELRSGSRGYRFSVVPTLIGSLDARSEFPQRISLIWRGTLKVPLRPGDHVRARVKFLSPPGPVWPGGYDPSFVRWFQAIGGTGIALQAPMKVSTSSVKPVRVDWTGAVEAVRLNVARRIRAALPGTRGAVAVALITGDRSAIPDGVRDDLRASGLAHLLAISGLHMALFAGGVFWLFRAVFALNVDLALRWPIKKWAAAAALVSAGGYLLLSGAGLATQRAFIMITIMFVAIMLDRPALSMRNVALAALTILMMRPESVLSVSFQLSFLAVIALVAFYEFLNEVAAARSKPFVASSRLKRVVNYFAQYFWGVGLTTLIAGLATAPVAAYHFNRVAAFGLIGNLLAVPVVGTLVMPAAIFALIAMPFGLETWPLAVMGEGIALVVWVAKSVADLPGAVRTIAQMPLYSGLLLACGMLWLCLWRGRWRLLGPGAMLTGMIISPLVQSLPAVIVADKAQQVAVRTDGNILVFSSARAGKYAAGRWLLKFGDPVPFKQAIKRKGFACDSYGCTITLASGPEVSVVRHPSILDEECRRASVVITTFNIRGDCPSARKLITPKELKQKGVHALVLSEEIIPQSGGQVTLQVHVKTARRKPGERPWTAKPRRYWKREAPVRLPRTPPAPLEKKPEPQVQPTPPLQVRI